MAKLTSLIVAPDGDVKTRARWALQEYKEFGETECASDLAHVTRLIGLGSEYDIIFISSQFDRTGIGTLVTQCKSTTAGQDSTYILLVQGSEQSAGSLGLYCAAGVDGFLLEPYGAEQLRDIVALAQKVKHDRPLTRRKTGLALLVSDLVDQLNLVAYLKKSGFDYCRSLERLRTISKPLSTLGEEMTEVYNEVLIELFEASPYPEHLKVGKPYTGSSRKTKAFMEKSLLKEFDELRKSGECDTFAQRDCTILDNEKRGKSNFRVKRKTETPE